MQKIINRAYVATFLLILLFMIAFLRLTYLALGQNYSQVATSQGTLSVKVDVPRGTIFDRNMTPLSNNKSLKRAVLVPTPETVTSLYRFFDKTRADEISELLKSGNPIVVDVPENYECNDSYIFECKASDDQKNTAIHILGYLNGDSKGVCGLQNAYNDLLKNDAPTRVIFQSDAVGSVLLGVEAQVDSQQTMYNKGIVTTLDSRVQQICDEVLKGVNSGAIVVTDATNGEIRALSSAPSFSYSDIVSALKNEKSPLLDRCLTQYNLGSIFKVCVAAAALESGIPADKTYTCGGSVTCSGNRFMCHKKEGHGVLDMSNALSQSCNCYFINLALETGALGIRSMAIKMGFAESFFLYDGNETVAATLPSLSSLSSDAALANFAIGQGALMATPLTMALAFGAVANNGVYFTPTLVTATVDQNGNKTELEHASGRRIMSAKNADILMNMMKNTVESGTGTGAKPERVLAAGKTATAETGMVDKNGNAVNQTWFVGAVPANRPEYVISVLVENGVSGGVSAAPVFKEICDKLYAE